MEFRILSYSTVLSGSDVIPVCLCYADSNVKYRPLIFMCPHICLLAAVRLSTTFYKYLAAVLEPETAKLR